MFIVLVHWLATGLEQTEMMKQWRVRRAPFSTVVCRCVRWTMFRLVAACMVIVRVHRLANGLVQTEMMMQWQVRKYTILTFKYSGLSLCSLDHVRLVAACMFIMRVKWLAKGLEQTEIMMQWQVRKDAVPLQWLVTVYAGPCQAGCCMHGQCACASDGQRPGSNRDDDTVAGEIKHVRLVAARILIGRVHCMAKGLVQTEVMMQWQVRSVMSGWLLHACPLTVCMRWLKVWCKAEMMMQWQVRKDAVPTFNYSGLSLCTLDHVRLVAACMVIDVCIGRPKAWCAKHGR
jgi:hypothetical protein